MSSNISFNYYVSIQGEGYLSYVDIIAYKEDGLGSQKDHDDVSIFIVEIFQGAVTKNDYIILKFGRGGYTTCA